MIMTYYLRLLFIIMPLISFSQVGINTNTPVATLDVQGNTLIEGSLFLENPANNTNIVNPTLLIRLENGDIVTYDIDVSRYGPINFSQFIFRRVASDGLLDFDTRIPTDSYAVTLQGFSILGNNNGSGQGGYVLGRSTVNNNAIEGYQFYAYHNTTTNTWWIRSFINNSNFTARDGSIFYVNSTVDIFINTLIYKNEFITTTVDAPVVVDMNNSETGTAPLPAGF